VAQRVSAGPTSRQAHAARLLDAGSRLTSNVRSPPLYDLTRH
jgi:hypothetical protein